MLGSAVKRFLWDRFCFLNSARDCVNKYAVGCQCLMFFFYNVACSFLRSLIYLKSKDLGNIIGKSLDSIEHC